METEVSKLVENYIDHYCNEKRYPFTKTPQKDHLRIDVSNLKEKINVNVYHTGKIVVGGSPKLHLKVEFDGLKKQLDETPEILNGLEKSKVKACANRYNILLPDTRKKIQESLPELGNTEYIIDPTPSEEYRVKLSADRSSVSVTQYKNGTLFLQGKADRVFDLTCDLIERIATPSAEEVICRFLSGDDASLSKFTSKYTPQLLQEVETYLKKILGDDLFNFLEPHDQKWLIAAECLRISNIPLPEFSPIIMPASKAFEGFIKKLLVGINFFPSSHFNTKGSSFSYLKDRSHNERKNLESKEMNAGTYLDKIGVCLDTNRNFMMHSDGNQITKIEKYEEAVIKLDEIYDDLKEIFKYFKNPAFGLL